MFCGNNGGDGESFADVNGSDVWCFPTDNGDGECLVADNVYIGMMGNNFKILLLYCNSPYILFPEKLLLKSNIFGLYFIW